MNTPSHAVVNAAVLGRRYPLWPVLAGAVLPDAPIYLFYWSDRFLSGAPESRIWSVDYFRSSWQPAIDALHSFPLIALTFLLARHLGWLRCETFSASAFLHSLGDFPFHHDDAHRHFFPFSDYRFRSPVSYWDWRHHGALGAAVELILVLLSLGALCRTYRSKPAICGFAFLGLLYTAAYLALYRHG